MIEIHVEGDRETVARITGLPGGIRQQLRQAMQKLGFRLQRHVQADKLSGQVLNVRTGVLRSSINLRVEDGDNEIIASVGTNVKYGAVHEFGWSGEQSVRAHLRLGRPVRAHTRNVTYPERSFLRSALADMRADIREGMADAVREAVRR